MHSHFIDIYAQKKKDPYLRVPPSPREILHSLFKQSARFQVKLT